MSSVDCVIWIRCTERSGSEESVNEPRIRHSKMCFQLNLSLKNWEILFVTSGKWNSDSVCIQIERQNTSLFNFPLSGVLSKSEIEKKWDGKFDSVLYSRGLTHEHVFINTVVLVQEFKLCLKVQSSFYEYMYLQLMKR